MEESIKEIIKENQILRSQLERIRCHLAACETSPILLKVEFTLEQWLDMLELTLIDASNNTTKKK